MGYLLYLMYRCDRRCDRCDGKFGNLVGTKHTQGKLGKAVICVFIDVLSTCTFDKCKHLQLYCFWEIEAMHYILVEYVKLADFASSFWCSVFFRSLLFWFSSERTSAVLLFSLSIRLSLLWMVICLTFYPGCSCAQLMDGKLFIHIFWTSCFPVWTNLAIIFVHCWGTRVLYPTYDEWIVNRAV